ncbi:MAG: universal stress protein [Thiotrichaceae bacterium]|nr:universal stress protein [Thiotrichaceae bacterium]PCI10893.1 MAG: universal stress protein, UspA [Thiotrichales bacterium]PCI13366.1 MAG: universal stress protein, UspA [Thiotrichales bacterium]
MKRFKNILFVKEAAASCEAAFERAVALAESNQASLTVIDVVEHQLFDFSVIPKGLTSDSLKHAILDERCEQLEALVAAAREKITVATTVAYGIPYIEMIRKVLRDGHDLVIKPAYNSGGLKAGLFGSTDMHLLRKCPIPVWLMKMPKSGKFKRILAAVDIGHENDKAQRDALSMQIVELSSSLALTEFGELNIVHAWHAVGESTLRGGRGGYSGKEVDDYVDDVMVQHRQWLDALYRKATQHLGKDALNYLKPQIHTPKGWPRQAIPQLVQEINIDLLVMGTVARTGLPGFFMGNTAEVIINNIHCSVLAVKPEEFVTPVTLED